MALEVAPHASQADTRRSRGAVRVPIRVYLMVLVLLFVAIGGVGTVYIGSQAHRDALRTAGRQATFWAGLAARDVGTNIAALRSTVSGIATNPGIGQVFADPSLCTLTFGLDLFGGGHLDVVRSDRSMLCSSLPKADWTRASGYASAGWFARAQRGAVLASPTPDPITGKPAVVSASPVPGLGVVAAFVDLGSLGPHLSAALGQPTGIEFLVTTRDGATVLSRSIAPARWAGVAVRGGPFVLGQANVERGDLDGIPRVYGGSFVRGAGWAVLAGADRAAALSSAGHLYRSDLTILLIGVAALLIAAYVVYSRITGPIQRLSAAVRAASEGGELAPIHVKGPERDRRPVTGLQRTGQQGGR
jgi:hypothetical protein